MSMKLEIILKNDAQPFKQVPPPYTAKQRVALRKFTDAGLRDGLIELSTSDYSSRAVALPTEGGEYDIFVDFRQLNEMTEPHSYQIETVERLLFHLPATQVFATIEVVDGSGKVPVKEKSRKYLAFSTPEGQFQWKVMPTGLSNGPAVLQQYIRSVLRPCYDFTKVYMDSILICSKSPAENKKHVKAVTKCLNDAGLKFVVRAKNQPTIPYMGLIVSREGLRPDPRIIEEMFQTLQMR